MDNLEYELSPFPGRRRDEIEIEINTTPPREEGDAIGFSIKIVNALQEKAKEFNSHNKRRMTVQQLKKVFCLAVQEYEPEDAGCSNVEWAMARVNMYLRMVSGQIKKLSKNLDNAQKISYNKFVEITANWKPSKEDFSAAKTVIEKNSLHFTFKTIEELYLDYQPIRLHY
tara:strand:- start:1294 stop:1803 length:510 start_codon:yes stop_codon:yes gene_type:complete